MAPPDVQLLIWLEEISLDGSELDDDLGVDIDSDDSVADPTYVDDFDDDMQYIDVSNEIDVNIQSTPTHAHEAVDTLQNGEQLACENWIITPSASVMRGKNKYIWSSEPSSTTKVSNRTPSRNIVHIMPGPKEGAKGIVDPLKCFELFFTTELRDEVLLRTNEYIDQAATKYTIQNTTTSQVTIEELRALIGIFIMSGAIKNNHLSTVELFDPTICDVK
ncbi:uncharacterized protein LOC125778695 [Bactrocera dorsalis]|uniref:Uncharacterized protein LOC125778695 n=1 Tax=Bactrocera dorsalis TaxID=27457 RepID=A0ABM3JWU3_BACDO|nr:uncharacterized protein LOC125778695 [Bactrocera dorsalis]